MSGNKSSQDVQLIVSPDYPDVWLTQTEEWLEWLDGQIESSANDVAEMRSELQKLSEKLEKRRGAKRHSHQNHPESPRPDLRYP